MGEVILKYLDDHEYFFLLSSHVVMLIFYPFVMGSEHPSLWIHILISIILITWLYAANSHERFMVRTMILGVFALVLTWVNFLFDAFYITLLLNIIWLLFFAIILYNLVINLHNIDEINKHVVFGAMAGYLVLWLIGAFVFAIIELTLPGSFSGFHTLLVSFPDFIYYSYVSMTTLGYGDILPIGYHAQSWSIMFTIAGQIYLAVLIGMIVGKYVRK